MRCVSTGTRQEPMKTVHTPITSRALWWPGLISMRTVYCPIRSKTRWNEDVNWTMDDDVIELARTEKTVSEHAPTPYPITRSITCVSHSTDNLSCSKISIQIADIGVPITNAQNTRTAVFCTCKFFFWNTSNVATRTTLAATAEYLSGIKCKIKVTEGL